MSVERGMRLWVVILRYARSEGRMEVDTNLLFCTAAFMGKGKWEYHKFFLDRANML